MFHLKNVFIGIINLDFIRKSIKRKLIFFSALSLMVTSLSIITYSIIKTRINNLNYSRDNALALAKSYSDNIKQEFEQNLKIAETYSSALSTIKSKDYKSSLTRQDIIVQTRRIIEDNPNILGLYVIFEPNAFDGKDAENISKLGSDETGRVNTYWARDENGTLVLEAEPDTNLNDPTEGDYYYWAKEYKSSRLLEPSLYPIAGKEVFMSAFSAPILADNQFCGITGLDFSIDHLHKKIKEMKNEETNAKLTLISHEGLVIASQINDSLIGKDFSKFCKHFGDIKKTAFNSNVYNEIVDDTLNIALQVPISRTGTPWIVLIQVPMANINSTANVLAIKLIFIAALFGLFGVGLNYYFAHRISKPIVKLTSIANKVAQGDLSELVQPSTKDEVKELGNSFNLVINALASMQNQVLDMHANIINGNLSHRADSTALFGSYSLLLDNVNSVVEGIVHPLRESAEYFKQISRGQIPNEIEQHYSGEFEEIKHSLNNCITAINRLITDTEATFQAAIIGKLNYRADSTAHQGDFKDIINGFNATLDRLVGLIDQMPLAVHILDSDNNKIYRNRKSREIEG